MLPDALRRTSRKRSGCTQHYGPITTIAGSVLVNWGMVTDNFSALLFVTSCVASGPRPSKIGRGPVA